MVPTCLWCNQVRFKGGFRDCRCGITWRSRAQPRGYLCTPNSLCTPPTDTDRTKMSCLVLSVSAVWTELATRQDSFVLSRPGFQFAAVQSQIIILRTTKNLKIRNRVETTQNCLVLFPMCSQLHTANCLVLSVSAVWTGYNSQFRLPFRTLTLWICANVNRPVTLKDGDGDRCVGECLR